ncbi:hypothetical protein L484_027160 [Morus notabilis]|uniref:Uncharacterized protein n=1 Tax=Morus notabilis TaxID=981085 RepID=W9SQ99_9ROSA|nr:hypothetical protein L484_027160 [Morus notabilis]
MNQYRSYFLILFYSKDMRGDKFVPSLLLHGVLIHVMARGQLPKSHTTLINANHDLHLTFSIMTAPILGSKFNTPTNVLLIHLGPLS